MAKKVTEIILGKVNGRVCECKLCGREILAKKSAKCICVKGTYKYLCEDCTNGKFRHGVELIKITPKKVSSKVRNHKLIVKSNNLDDVLLKGFSIGGDIKRLNNHKTYEFESCELTSSYAGGHLFDSQRVASNQESGGVWVLDLETNKMQPCNSLPEYHNLINSGSWWNESTR